MELLRSLKLTYKHAVKGRLCLLAVSASQWGGPHLLGHILSGTCVVEPISVGMKWARVVMVHVSPKMEAPSLDRVFCAGKRL